MTRLQLVGLVYGILLTSGAYFGWKAGSQVSLIMGLVSGALVLLFVWLAGGNFTVGAWGIAVVSALLTVTFILRFIETKKMMPSGMLLLVSLVVLIFTLIQIFKK